MEIKFGEFKSAVTDLPTKDGNYLVLGFYRGEWFTATSLTFTVEYGWNTDEQNRETRIDYGDRGPDFEYVWTDIVTKVEEEV